MRSALCAASQLPDVDNALLLQVNLNFDDDDDCILEINLTKHEKI